MKNLFISLLIGISALLWCSCISNAEQLKREASKRVCSAYNITTDYIDSVTIDTIVPEALDYVADVVLSTQSFLRELRTDEREKLFTAYTEYAPYLSEHSPLYMVKVHTTLRNKKSRIVVYFPVRNNTFGKFDVDGDLAMYKGMTEHEQDIALICYLSYISVCGLNWHVPDDVRCLYYWTNVSRNILKNSRKKN